MVEKKFTKIYFRILPMEKMIWDYLKILNDHKTIYIRCLQELSKSKENVVPSFWTFRSDNVFFNQSQKEIYNEVMPEVVDNVSQGCDAIVMAYGQTGTGKSLTLSGLYNPYEDRGILPRVVSELFEKLQTNTAKNNIKECIQVSYVEFSKTTINDLLRAFPNHVYSFKDINKIKVRNVEEVFKILFKGEGRKLFSENSPYESHSHSSIFTFYISMKNTKLQGSSTHTSKLHIIDLAGVDTVGNSSCLFKNSLDIGTANLTKTELEQFFLIFSSGISEQIRIKQRLNPIIFYLGDSIKKTTIIRLIGHIRTTREDLLITISMLRFGQLIGGLKSTKYEMKVEDYSKEKLDNLQKELNKLKLENQYNAFLMHQDLSKSINEERHAHIERTVNEYLQNKITQLTLINVCDIQIALEVMKTMCTKSEDIKIVKKDTASVGSTRSKKSSSQIKIRPKSSRTSNKTSSDVVVKHLSEEKQKRGSSATSDLKSAPKTQPYQVPKTRSKTSNSSLLKKPSTTRRKSNSSAASLRERSKSKSKESVLMPQISPDYSEAWNLYVKEHNEDYVNFVKLYERNEVVAKNVYRAYLKELDILKEITSRLGKNKNDLLMAKMTRQFQQAYTYGDEGASGICNFESFCSKGLEQAEREYIDKQEQVLKCQTELKTYIGICKDIKKNLQRSFDQFCKDKYQAEVINLEMSQESKMNIVDNLLKVGEEVPQQAVEENKEATAFAACKPLIDVEKRKRRMYLLRHREWTA